MGILRPHLPFGAPAKYLEPYRDVAMPPVPHPEKPEGRTTWHGSGEFMKYNRWGRNPNDDAEFSAEVRRHYAACVTYADAQVGRLLEKLNATGKTGETIVVVWGDHGWHLGEHAIWGKHCLFEEALRSPLVISYPGLPKAGEVTDGIVETLDLFPTLCELAELPAPDFVDGVSLKPLLENPSAEGHPAFAYSRGQHTVRTDTHRLILHKDGYTELYDHTTEAGETVNVSEDQPDQAKALGLLIKEQFGK